MASVKLTRDFVRSSLGRTPPVPTGIVHDVELAVSELATNGVSHGSGGPILVDLDRSLDLVTMSVTSTLAPNGDSDPAAWERTDPSGPIGRGIGIVRAVSTDLTFSVTGRSVAATCRFPITL